MENFTLINEVKQQWQYNGDEDFFLSPTDYGNAPTDKQYMFWGDYDDGPLWFIDDPKECDYIYMQWKLGLDEEAIYV